MSLLYAYSALPPLNFNQIPPISLNRFYDILDLNLGKKEKANLVSLRSLIDVKNILSFQTGVGFNAKGNFLEAGLALALSNAEYLPEYILNFLEENPDEKDLIKNFPQLYATFFREEIAHGGISAEFLTFEKNLNLILLGYIGKKQGVDVESYLKYEDLGDPLISQIILQSKNTGPYLFPYEYADLGESIEATGADPMKQYIAIHLYRFKHYKEIIDNQGGSFRSICAYMMCLWILEEKAFLDEKKGRKILTELVESEYE
ncbi:MAG: hypothetical protein SP4CHLAM5_07460 [Chlamydiia bacterium]|nr:hypothetical protein [Chlamydiia bacterium]MCH9618613.1 hypothetical protein [Chlamydiia bacterium]MCH9624333.1 hypothetical protein [Chlamydiia bacterium]